MANKNHNPPAPKGQLSEAFTQAFCPQENDNQRVDPAEALQTYFDLVGAGDDTAGAQALGNCIMSLPHVDRAACIDLLIWCTGWQPAGEVIG